MIPAFDDGLMTNLPVLLTFDIDWAPDFVITALHERLQFNKIRATWFLTHTSPAVDALLNDPDQECGLHPNYFDGSSHGDSLQAVTEFALALAPKAKSVRTHGLYQSSLVHQHWLKHTGLQYDASLFLPRASHVEPVKLTLGDKTLIRFPFVWEDDVEMARPDPHWKLEEVLADTKGEFIILNFHPIHWYLNQPKMEAYQSMKTTHHLAELTEAQASSYVREGAKANGPRQLLEEVIHYMQEHKQNFTLSELAGTYKL